MAYTSCGASVAAAADESPATGDDDGVAAGWRLRDDNGALVGEEEDGGADGLVVLAIRVEGAADVGLLVG